MKYQEIYHYSNHLQRNMSVKIYGHYGISILCFPCQDKMSDDFSNFGMIDNLADYIEQGKIKLFCVDSIDYETYSNNWLDKRHRSYMVEKYYNYIIDEVLPIIYNDNNGFCLPYVCGFSMGATHSSIMFFRRPELFSGIIALSGNYDIKSFFDNYMDEFIYNNSPIEFINNMDYNHHYINMYNEKTMIFCVGNGMFEEQVRYSHIWLDEACRNKHINAWFDYWGDDCSHDWYWWKKQMRYYLEKIL